MAHLVTIQAGKKNVSLPNRLVYSDGEQALLSNYQYSRLSLATGLTLGTATLWASLWAA